MTASQLYEPLLERDLARIPEAVRQFRTENSPDDLFAAVARFAVLSYAPSQHAKHAVLSVLAAHDLKDEFGEAWDELLTQCAIYAAQSRQPWSEAPILDPPEPARDGSIDELREAVAAQDRLRAERWLARRIDDPQLGRDYFLVASDDFEDLGHKLIVAVAAWKLAAILGEKGRFATLRIGVWEMCAYSGSPAMTGPGENAAPLLDGLIERCVEEKGSLESAHAIFLLDAAFDALTFTRESMILDRVCAWLHEQVEDRRPRLSGQAGRLSSTPFPYPLARDYAAHLKSYAVAKRLRSEFSDARVDDFIAATKYNLENAPSFEEWSFA